MIRSLCLFVLALAGLLPLPALANALVPADRWIDKAAVAKPIIAYRLGLVDLATPGGEIANELPAAARIVLKRAGYFAADGAQRAHVRMAIRSLGGGKAVVEYAMYSAVPGGNPADGPVLYREVVSTETDNHSVADENTTIRVLSGNLKLFALGLRTRFDPGFAAQGAQLAAAAREEVGSRDLLSYIGEGTANALVATVEGTGEVLGTLGEIAASEEFQRGLAGAADEYSRQQASMAAERAAERNRMAVMQAAAQREREVRAANERARQAEQQADQARRVAAVQQQAAERQLAQAAQRKAESEARAARQAAEQKERASRQETERAARIARQDQEARKNAARQMRGFAQSSTAAPNGVTLADAGEARVGAGPVPVASKPSRGRARAWCRVTKGGEYWCNGPLQNGGWGNTVKKALAMVDCPNGSGYTPTYGTGGTSFDCGRELRSTEQEMPLYDPFYKYGKSN